MAERENSNPKGKPADQSGERKPSSASTGAHEAFTRGRTTGQFEAMPSAPRKTGSLPVQSSPGPKTASQPAAQPLAHLTQQPGSVTISGARKLTDVQKSQLSSAFQGAREAESKAKRALALGKTARPFADDEDEPTSIGKHFDGNTAPTELTNRDVWKAVQAPAQSREGRRSADVYKNVIDQFAVGTNPRYEPDAPEKPRAHIFVWDVSRAMNCEIPHFVGAKELTLGQTVDWLRHEGPMRGWMRATEEDAHAAAQGGQLAVVLPRDIKLKLMAIVLPEAEPDEYGKPWVAGAAKARGKRLTLAQALGSSNVEYFVHV